MSKKIRKQPWTAMIITLVLALMAIMAFGTSCSRPDEPQCLRYYALHVMVTLYILPDAEAAIVIVDADDVDAAVASAIEHVNKELKPLGKTVATIPAPTWRILGPGDLCAVYEGTTPYETGAVSSAAAGGPSPGASPASVRSVQWGAVQAE